MIVKLTFTDVTKQFVSDKVHVLRVALAHKVKPDSFLTWLEAEKGERNVVVTYNRDGAAKPPKSSNTGDSTTGTATTQRASKSHVDLVRDQLKSSALITLAKGSVGKTLDDLKTDIELSAIIVRQADGTFVVKTVVEDSEAVDAVYAGYYRANAEQVESAAKQKKIEELLANPEDLAVADIRKQLGNDIGDKAAEAAIQAKAFRDDLKTTPPELKHYVSLLKAADFVAKAHSGKSSDSHYEKALEELEQVLGRDPSLGVYLDRPFSPDIDPNQEDAPRPINSKSHYAKAGGATITKQDMLRQTLRQELDDLRGVSDADAKAADAVIASGMALLNKYVTRG
ncbi:hypothetical protein [Paraburkholderia sp. UCT2]|uniref:hypothetical protein n=1 Tax=Paraburkholderia sp. UCT2 TaxID=2615208 RepID=UPI0016557833|nr:hypothetical protein [Paraburkholderia sp. UCT2]MBC8733451.1 hypothetical protein [Paraburkholderia sp. UCT2]